MVLRTPPSYIDLIFTEHLYVPSLAISMRRCGDGWADTVHALMELTGRWVGRWKVITPANIDATRGSAVEKTAVVQ